MYCRSASSKSDIDVSKLPGRDVLLMPGEGVVLILLVSSLESAFTEMCSVIYHDHSITSC